MVTDMPVTSTKLVDVVLLNVALVALTICNTFPPSAVSNVPVPEGNDNTPSGATAGGANSVYPLVAPYNLTLPMLNHTPY